MSDTWRDHAACKGANPAHWFPSDRGTSGASLLAKKICAGCPVSEECLSYALEHNEYWGIWGGLSREERAKLRTSRRRRA